MGVFSDFFEGTSDIPNPGADITGATGAAAARSAAELQAQLGREGIALQREQLERLIGLQQPFLQFGQGQIDPLQQLLAQQQDPAALTRLQQLGTTQGQADFIQNNPFFDALTGRAKSDLFANQAARGKVGSGGTAAELQNRFVGIGQGLLQQERQGLAQTADLTSGISQRNIGNLFKGVGIGQSAASLTASGAAGVTDNITSLLSGIGASGAAGAIGAANAQQQGTGNIISAIGAIFSDRRVKKNVIEIDSWMAPSGKTYPTYEAEYLWSDDRFICVMSDDVKKINPSAVFEVNGIEAVNYGRL